ncbi:MAG: hypothetical protein HY775_01595 [Acidobacteria bacterium]|nr:hypothetical protein [Acidobacteriota bacterium]
MRARLAVTLLSLAALAAPSAARATRYDYSWALPEWRQTWSAPRLADNRGFAVRSTTDAVYVAGVTGSHGQGAGDLFLLKYDQAGALLWSRTWGGFELDQAQGIAVDETGIWAAGSRTTDEGRIEFALVRFSPDGELLLDRTWARGVADVLQAVAVYDGALYVAGLTQPSHADRNLYVARLGSDGAPAWEIERGGPGWDEAWDLAVDAMGVYVAGYETQSDTSQALLLRLDQGGAVLGETRWGGPENDEARALTLSSDGILVTGGQQSGRSTDVFVSKLGRDGGVLWTKTTGGKVVGGGGYGIGLGDQGIYVAGGNYDFPAGGDGAIMRFSLDGDLEWSQVYGLPGFWDWGFDVDVRAGRFYVTGVLWQPGAEWYNVLTLQYREDFPSVSLTDVARLATEGDPGRATAAMQHFWPGDFLRWAEALDASDPGRSYVRWEGGSDAGRRYGMIWADTARDPAVGEDQAVEAFEGVGEDVRKGNYSLVRDYIGVSASLLDGLIRLRYFISHDRLIPQGGYVYVGNAGVPLPPPPV